MNDNDTQLLEEAYEQINEDKMSFYRNGIHRVTPGMAPTILRSMKEYAMELSKQVDQINQNLVELNTFIEEVEGKYERH